MAKVEVDTLYLCRDGHVRRVGRDWDDGTITWILDPIPAIADALVGTCTREAFAAMVDERVDER
jgi:hypothetical protein